MLIPIKEAIGKRIVAVHSVYHDDQCGFVFNDGTYAILTHHYAGESTFLEDVEPDEVDDSTLVQMGVITSEEAQRRRAERMETRRQTVERQQRAEYERLKAVYENKS